MSADGSAIDPDKLKAYSFLLFSKLEGAMTSGWCTSATSSAVSRWHGARGRMDVAAARRRHGPRRAVGAGVGPTRPRRSCCRGLGRDGIERFTMTPEAIAVLSDPDHPAFGMGMFHRLPQTMQTLERSPSRSAPASASTTRGRAEPASSAASARGTATSSCVALPALDGVVPMLEAGARDRHRLRRRHRRAHDGGQYPSRRSTATTSPSTPLGESSRRRGLGTPTSTTRARIRSPTTIASTS